MTGKKRFIWSVMAEPNGTFDYRWKGTSLGDGYSQVAADGINVGTQNWSVTIRKPNQLCGAPGEGEGTQALAFLREQGQKAESFEWVTPLGELILVEVGKFTLKKGPGYLDITFAFAQVYR